MLLVDRTRDMEQYGSTNGFADGGFPIILQEYSNSFPLRVSEGIATHET